MKVLATKNISAVLAAGVWINASEFFRNEVLLKHYWIEHFQSLGIAFPSEPINGVLWLIWGFISAFATWIISKRFDLLQAVAITWLMTFVLMWVVLWNLAVLPMGILAFAVPLSVLEVLVATLICKKLSST